MENTVKQLIIENANILKYQRIMWPLARYTIYLQSNNKLSRDYITYRSQTGRRQHILFFMFVYGFQHTRTLFNVTLNEQKTSKAQVNTSTNLKNIKDFRDDE